MIAEFIQPDDPRWTQVLEEASHDVYHLPAYTRFAAAHEGGRAVAFYARDERGAFLAPLLLRDLPAALDAAPTLCDATSPYGYPAPIVTNPDDVDAVARYLGAFASAGRDAGIVTAFFRLHPLLRLPHAALARHGVITTRGETVPVSLAAPLETLRAQTRANHRSGIRKLLAAGYVASMDDWSAYAEFAALYRETMRRVGATDFYLFSDGYFADLRDALGDRLHLCTIRAPGGELAASGIFTETNGIVQYHLGGTAGPYLSQAPSKVMFDCVRQWAKERGCTVLHLGGGLGGRADSLFNFKAGFSPERAAFATYDMVLDAERYVALTKTAEAIGDTGSPGFFPAYRAPRHPVPRMETVMTSPLPPLRVFLSPPHLTGEEGRYLEEALRSNWIAPLGPHVDAFEQEFAAAVGASHALAVSTGTAALHLSLQLAGVTTGDEVLVSTLTFAASVNPIRYLGGVPVFIDSEMESWNMDPALLAETLDARARAGRLPKAVVLVHLYGQCADIDPIVAACERHGVALIEDAAEALGATYRGRAPGTFGLAGAFSFNGNKIITTSGGGMLVSEDAGFIAHARKLATQARDPAPHYEHSEIGYNYRLSNLLAGIGRAQLATLEDRVITRRGNFDRYTKGLGDLPGITMMPEAAWGRHSRWLTCITVDPTAFGTDRETLRLALAAVGIEARPLWKPMHLQPVFSSFESVGGTVAAGLFEQGLCLPSGSNLAPADLDMVVEIIRAHARPATTDAIAAPGSPLDWARMTPVAGVSR